MSDGPEGGRVGEARPGPGDRWLRPGFRELMGLVFSLAVGSAMSRAVLEPGDDAREVVEAMLRASALGIASYGPVLLAIQASRGRRVRASAGEAIWLAQAAMLALLACSFAFSRRSILCDISFGTGWIGALVLSLGTPLILATMILDRRSDHRWSSWLGCMAGAWPLWSLAGLAILRL